MYNLNQDLAPPMDFSGALMGGLQTGQQFSEGLLKQHQAQKLANLQDQYANAPDAATQQGLLAPIAAYSPEISQSIRVNQNATKAQRDEFLARGANDILQAPPEQQSAMHDQLLIQGIKQGYLPPETSQHLGQFDESDVQEMQNLVRRAQPMSAISPAAQQAARVAQMKEMAELGKLQADTNRTNLETNALYGNGELQLKNAGQLGADQSIPPIQQGGLGTPDMTSMPQQAQGALGTPPINMSPIPGNTLGGKPSLAEQEVATVPPTDMAAAEQGMIPPQNPTSPANISVGGQSQPVSTINGIQEAPNPLDQYDISGYNYRITNLAKSYIDGRMPLPNITSRTPATIQSAFALAQQADPTLDVMSSKIRYDARKDVTEGKSAQSIKSLNTAIGHLGRLSDNFDKLNNSDVTPMINTIENSVMQINNPKLQSTMTKVSTDATAVSHELATVFRNQGMSEGEIKDWQSKINTSNTPAQNKAVIDEALALMNTRLESIKDQYEKGMRVKIDNPVQLLNSESQKVYNRLSGNTSETIPPKESIATMPGSQAELQKQSANQQIATREGQTATNPQTGHTITFRGGKWQ